MKGGRFQILCLSTLQRFSNFSMLFQKILASNVDLLALQRTKTIFEVIVSTLPEQIKVRHLPLATLQECRDIAKRLFDLRVSGSQLCKNSDDVDPCNDDRSACSHKCQNHFQTSKH
eukprot:2127253-Amphidinium_carterae.5